MTRVALAHDWLTGMRGGEKVLERLALAYPQAPIFTLVHEPGSVSETLESHSVRTSFLQRMPARSAYRWYLPLFPLAVRGLDVSGFDLVLSTSHCAIKALRTSPDALHLCYCHTPMRYAWDRFDEYFGPARVGWFKHALIRPTMALLRRWDRATAARVDYFAANSQYVADRIGRYYDRTAEVIPPPVDTDRFVPGTEAAGDYYLMVSALSPYKRVDVAIEAFNRLGRPLYVAGWGPEAERLKQLAGPTVRLLGKVSDDELLTLYQNCRGFVLPGVEDAGIAPIEAMACGRPALVLAEGGAPEAVEHGVTGLHIDRPGADAICEAVDSAESLTFNTAGIRAHAEGYSVAEFDRRMGSFVERCLHARTATAAGRAARGGNS
jgi:glycosyltransferase involved in cell wall biosynthesis